MHCDLRSDNMLLDADLNLLLCDFDGSKNENYDEEDLLDFDFFDSRIDFFDVTTNIEIFGLDSSIYTILTGHLSHGSSILKTAQKRSNYAHIFERFALEGKFPKTSEIIDGDIIKNC